MAQYINGEECTRIGLKTRNTVKDFTIDTGVNILGNSVYSITSYSKTPDSTLTTIIPTTIKAVPLGTVTKIGAKLSTGTVTLYHNFIFTGGTVTLVSENGEEDVQTISSSNRDLQINSPYIYLKHISGRIYSTRFRELYSKIIEFPVICNNKIYYSAGDLPVSGSLFDYFGEYTFERYEDGGDTKISSVKATNLEGKVIIRPETNMAISAFSKVNGVAFSDGVTTIPQSAFAQSPIDELEFPDSIESIDTYAFYNHKCKSITIPDTEHEISIATSAFNSPYLEEFHTTNKNIKFTRSNIGSSIQALTPFYNTPFRQKVMDEQKGILCRDGTTIDTNAGHNYLIGIPGGQWGISRQEAIAGNEKYSNSLLYASNVDHLTCGCGAGGVDHQINVFQVIDAGSFKYVDDYAFNTKGIADLNLGTHKGSFGILESIGNNAFACQMYRDAFYIESTKTYLAFTHNLKKLGNNNFNSTSSWAEENPSLLETIYFQSENLYKTQTSNIQSIGSNCFNYHPNLKDVWINAPTPPNLGSGCFTNCPALEHIYVPAGSVDLYKTATNWVAFADKITAIE